MKRPFAALGFALAAGCCAAAGGHHAVDDANVQGDAVCRVEGWDTATRDAQVVHAGTACGYPFGGQVGVAVERAHAEGVSIDTPSVQVKWARDVTQAVALGWEASVAAPEARARDAVLTALALATWRASEHVSLHLNAGRDVPRTGASFARGGVGAEWWPHPKAMLVAERFLDTGTHYARGGVRWVPAPGWTVDLSRARRLAGPGESTWTVGIAHELKVR